MHHPAQETHGEPTLRLPEPSSELQPLLWHCPTNESHCFSTRELQLCLLSPTRPVHRGASSWHGSRQVLQGEGVRGDPRRSWFSSFKDPGLALPLFASHVASHVVVQLYSYHWLEGKHSTSYTVRPESWTPVFFPGRF